jgi:hypothetical protein
MWAALPTSFAAVRLAANEFADRKGSARKRATGLHRRDDQSTPMSASRACLWAQHFWEAADSCAGLTPLGVASVTTSSFVKKSSLDIFFVV